MSGHDSQLAQVRVLLNELLRSDTDLDAFCIDYFPTVHSRFASGLDRIQKVNILFEQVRDPAAIVTALRRQFPGDARAARWAKSPTAKNRRPLTGPCMMRGGVFLFILTVLPLSAWLLRHPWLRSPASPSCPSLQIDDVIVQPRLAQGPVVLNVILRNGGNEPANTTRTDVHVLEQLEERAPYAPSAQYDLLISGEHNELITAHSLSHGDVDHFVIKLGFPSGGPAHQYEAELRVRHTGHCTATSGRFFFSSQSD